MICEALNCTTDFTPRVTGQRRCEPCHDKRIPYKDGSRNAAYWRSKKKNKKKRGADSMGHIFLRKIMYSNFVHCALCKIDGPLSVDHIIPISKGGSKKLDNLQLLCKSCNNKKADKI